LKASQYLAGKFWIWPALFGAFFIPISAAHAHGFGQRFDLPIPLNLYMAGAGAAVIFSFVVMAMFGHKAGTGHTYPRFNLLRLPFSKVLTCPLILFAIRLFFAALFVVVIVAGFFGVQDPIQNIIHTAVWVIWWVGLAYFSALLGDIFALINPWRNIFSWVEAGVRFVRPEQSLSLGREYPEKWGVWPAVILFLAFAWVELVWGGAGGAVPANLAVAVLIYTVITWAGMAVFGREVWLQKGEVFSIVFGLLARFAPTEIRVAKPEGCMDCPSKSLRLEEGGCVNCYEGFARADKEYREINLRPYAAGLITKNTPSFSMVVLVLAVLSTVTFDGFLETPTWLSIEEGFSLMAGEMGGYGAIVVHTLGLVVFAALFSGVFVFFCRLMALTQNGDFSAMELARFFVFSLIPISFAYHLAHYIMFFLIGGQLIIPLASDPFGFGWNVLGTVNYRLNIGIVGAWFVWYTAVVAIVVGHIIAVYLAHVTAMSVFKDKALALKSQYPMLVLMVGYTLISLWILAQPIVEK
jgi:hypothetical protein